VSATEIVHPVPVDEIGPWLRAMGTTFLEDPAMFSGAADAYAPQWRPERSWGVRADGRWVGTLRTIPRRLTLPGTDVDIAADALTNVTVAATHRRQGLLNTMLTQSLDAAHRRGDAVSILVAAEWPIYGRFGYAPATSLAHYTAWTGRPGARISGAATGTVRQVEAEELARVAPDVFASARRLRAGNINRPADWWNRELGLNGITRADTRPIVHIVREGPDGIDGYVSWRSTGAWELTGELGQVTVRELTATTPAAYLDLCRYLFSIDVVDRVHLRERPVDEPLQWLLADGRAVTQTHRVDHVWLRLLDVPAALSARRYATTDELVIEVQDADGAGYAAGRYLLEGSPTAAQCTATTRAPDLRLSQRALAAAYLGGFSLTEQVVTGSVEQVRPGALARADALLATPLAPWSATSF
jgi:predicted acetyltransferase